MRIKLQSKIYLYRQCYQALATICMYARYIPAGSSKIYLYNTAEYFFFFIVLFSQNYQNVLCVLFSLLLPE